MEEERQPVDGARADGMGARPSGPSFDAPPPTSIDPEPSATPPTPEAESLQRPAGPEKPSARDFRPPPRRLPAVVTALAILLVAGVVAVASLTARQETPGTAPSATRPASATPTPTRSSSSEIPFSTPYGDGVLAVIGHSWSSDATRKPTHAYLTVRVRIRAVAGEIDVDPTYFQILDKTGEVFDSIPAIGGQRELATTTLAPGESTAGGVTFDVPRGEVTLLMGDGAQGITAIKVPA